MKQIFFILLIIIFNNAFAQLNIVLQTGNNNTINHLEFHDTKKLLLSSDNSTIVIWDTQQRKQYTSLDFSTPISKTGFLNESNIYVVVENNIEIWNFIELELVKSIKIKNNIKSVDFFENTIYFLTDKLYEYNIYTNTTNEISPLNYPINNFIISNHGKNIGLTTNQYYLIYNITTKSITHKVKISNCVTSFISDNLKTISIAISPSSVHTFSFKGETIKKLNVITNDRTWNNYSCVYLTNTWGISGDSKDNITTYNLNNGKIHNHYKNNSASVSKISANKDLTVIAVSGENGIINLYDHTFNLLHTFQSISPIPTCIKLINDSSKILIGYNNGDIKKWDFTTHEVSTLENINNKTNHKNLEIINLKANTGIVREYWKSSITNSIKYNYYNINFGPNFDEYTLNKINDYTHSNKTDLEILPNKNYIKLRENETVTFISKFIINNNYIVGSSSGFMYIIDQSGQELLKFVSPTRNSFFYLTPQNYYYASKNALKHVSARFKNQLIGFEQIDLIYNRPDKIIPIITSSYSQEYVDLLAKAYEKRLKKLNISIPSIENILNLPTFISTLKDIPINSSLKSISINIKAKSKKINLKTIHILINDVPLYGKLGLNIESSQTFDSTLNLTLSKGKNNIQIFIENEFGTKSLREKASINCKYSHQPTLHVLAIGSGTFMDDKYNLKYAAKDANDINSLFAKTRQFKEIKSTLIINHNVTIENINRAIEDLKKVNINDVIVVFFAGHGVLDQNLDYYLSTYNMNYNNPEENGLNFDLFENKLSLLKCRHKLLLIDACHSGEIDKEEIEEIENEKTNENEELLVFRSGQSSIGLIGGKSAFELSKNIFVDLRSNSGIVTISSAGAAEYALEGEKWKNGAFTYCLLKGIVNRDADFDKNKKISTNELQRYLFDEVPKLTNGKQTPTSRVELMEQNFIVW